jgi:ATP-dependent DNA ligase
VIGGFIDPQRSRVGLGALLIGYYSDGGTRLIYAGKLGTGYTRKGLLDFRETRYDDPAHGHAVWSPMSRDILRE